MKASKKARSGEPTGAARERAQVATRFDDEVYRKVAEAAAANRCSMSAEVERRVVQSFEVRQAEPDDPAQDLGREIMSAFVAGGRREARRTANAITRPEPPISEWMKDPICYTAAANSAVGILTQWHPRPLYSHCVLMIRSLAARLDALWLALVNNEADPEEHRKMIEHAEAVARSMIRPPSLLDHGLLDQALSTDRNER